VSEVPPPCEHHRDVVLVGCGNHFLIAHGAARLHDSRRAGGGKGVQAIPKWKERV
jgi:hypothetical protein